MTSALFINGIFEHVLEDIEAVQRDRPSQECFLQPHSSGRVAMFRRVAPSVESPIRLYASPHTDFNFVYYVGEIVRWEDKQELTVARRRHIRRIIKEIQPDELELFDGNQTSGKDSVNLITVRSLRRLAIVLPVRYLIKCSDGQPYQERARAGKWSEVRDIGADVVSDESATLDMNRKVAELSMLSDEELRTRLKSAPALPQRRMVLSLDFIRNAAVIVAVLRRADGTCESCLKQAPFMKRSDGSPYLEVHHRVRLADGGPDTVENAMALCPNCHRRAHHG